MLTVYSVIVIAALRLQSLHHARNDSDFNFTYTGPILWTLAEVHYSLIFATIPTLQIFLKNFTTGWLADLATHPETAMASKGSRDRYGRLSAIKNNMQSSMGKSHDETSILELRDWDRLHTTEARVYAHRDSDAVDDDAASDGSGRRILVRRTVDVSHSTK